MWPSREILAAFAESGIFADSKTLLDCPLKQPRQKVEQSFQALVKNHKGKFPIKALRQFYKKNFKPPGSDVVDFSPSDWQQPPDDWLPLVKNGPVRDWALHLHSLWRRLCRKTINEVAGSPDQHTLLPLPYPMFVPGDRFREIYYWDTHWVVKGLLVCNMLSSAEQQVRNLLFLADIYGHVPNGNRTYYINRSQPPLLSSMVRMIWEARQCKKFLAYAVSILIKEHEHWTTGAHSVTVIDSNGDVHDVSRYWADWDVPRPESFREDCQSACDAAGSNGDIYRHLASAAESGWDFSSRWLENPMDLSSIRTTRVVPVDLNAFLYQLEMNLADFLRELGKPAESQLFKDRAAKRRLAFDNIFWDAQGKQWKDYNLDISSKDSNTNTVFASNWIPAWAGILPGPAPDGDEQNIEDAKKAVVESLRSSGLILPGGIATSLVHSGQQWDFPNAWAPCQSMLIEGMSKMGSSGIQLASQLSQNWLKCNFSGYQNGTGHMYEKYDARSRGAIGGGGEYAPQMGFGWTNGVALTLLESYGLNLE